MLGKALFGRKDQEANFAVDVLPGMHLLLLAQLKKMRPYGKPTVLHLPHSHLHLTLGRHALTSMVPAGLALADMTAIVKITVLGKRAYLAIDMLSTLL